MAVLLVGVATFAGCGGAGQGESSASAERAVVAPSDGVDGQATAIDAIPPADAERFASTLAALGAFVRARDTDDLPSDDAISAYPFAEIALIELVDTEPTLGYRARALSMLGAVAGVTGRAKLVAIAADDAAHPLLVAGAVAGLGRLGWASDPEVEAVLREAAVSGDLRIQRAAHEALGER